VNAANSIIANNKEQFDKKVWTDNPQGEKITVMRATTDSEEGYKVANSIFSIKMQKQRANSDFAILYRTNAQSRSMEEALRKLNIPYRIYGGLSFYQRKEIKDVLAYFRLSINPNDDESMRRIINYPARGIGQTTIDKISVLAADNDVSMMTVMDNLQDFNPDINAGTSSKLRDFATMIRSFANVAKEMEAYDAANYIINHSGVIRELNKEKTPEDIARVENVEELLTAVKEFSETARTAQEQELKEDMLVQQTENPEDLFSGEKDSHIKTIDEFMQEIALLTDADKNKDDEQDRNKVSLMTIHAAKGLEFPYVYVVGMEENLFPSQMVLQSRTELEEERRLFYVALTRAEKQAFLTFAERRFRYGNHVFSEPSRFIDEIDEKFIHFPDVEATPKSSSNKSSGNKDWDFERDAISVKKTKTVEQIKPKEVNPVLRRNLVSANKASSNAAPMDTDVIKSIKEGTQVVHEKFGQGTVLSLEGAFPNIKATINFSIGPKQLLLKYAKLKVLG
jgi:DNA helicase-2/ATP-dependent DNA helicase PcrA